MHLFYLFIYTTCLALTLPLFFPFWHVPYFVPFLILCFYQSTFVGCLWWSLICGFIVDLFSADTRLGHYSMGYCLAILCLYRYKFHFFEDRFSTLPFMVYSFTFLIMLIQITIFSIIGKPFLISWDWIISDLLILPLQTSLYAIFCF